MKRKPLYAAALATVLVGAAFTSDLAIGFSSGPLPGYTGAPGEFSGACTACHNSYPLNSGSANFTVSVPTNLTPSAAHPVSVGFSGSSNTRHGFQVTMQDSAGMFKGAWVVTMNNPTQTQTTSSSAAYHEHTFSGNSLNAWTMGWQAPASVTPGPIKFYAAGNQANMDFSSSGDYIYTNVATMWQASLSTPNASWPTGTSQVLNLNAPGHASELYVIAVSEIPGQTPLGGPFILEANIFTGLSDLAWSLPSVFANFVGTTSATGTATATVNIPYYPPLAGFPLYFAAVTADSMLNPSEVSNPRMITFQ